jgi:hypothetical protein
MTLYPKLSRIHLLFPAITLAGALLLCAPARAQQLNPANAASPVAAAAPEPLVLLASADSAATDLPDAPTPTLAPAADTDPQSVERTKPAPKYEKYINPDETTVRLSVHDKFLVSAKDMSAPLTFAGIIVSAGYTHLVNGQPNYGTDRGAFGQRLGAGAIRNTTQGFFQDAIFSSMLHMDPRYYIQGPHRSFGHRVVYATTRLFIAKTDSGRNTFNAPLFLGYAGASALTPLYYPQINRNFKDVSEGYAGSLGGAAIGYLFDEFSGQLLRAVHLGGRN